MSVGRDCVNYGLTSEVHIISTNVLCAGKLHCRVDLTHIAKRLPNVTYNPKQMSCATLRHRKIGKASCVAVLFASGHMSVNGSKNTTQAKVNFRCFARLIQKLGYPVRLETIRVLSISATARLPYFVIPDIKYAVRELGAVYEPEIHNSACLKVKGMSLLIFHSGSLVVTGLRFGQSHRKLLHRIINNLIHNGKEA